MALIAFKPEREETGGHTGNVAPLVGLWKYSQEQIRQLLNFLVEKPDRYGFDWRENGFLIFTANETAMPRRVRLQVEQREKVRNSEDARLVRQMRDIAGRIPKDAQEISLFVPCENLELYKTNTEIEKKAGELLRGFLEKRGIAAKIKTSTIVLTPKAFSQVFLRGEEEGIKRLILESACVFADAKGAPIIDNGKAEDSLKGGNIPISYAKNEWGASLLGLKEFKALLRAQGFEEVKKALENIGDIALSFPKHSEDGYLTALCDRIREISVELLPSKTRKRDDADKKKPLEQIEEYRRESATLRIGGEEAEAYVSFDKNGELLIDGKGLNYYLSNYGDAAEIEFDGGKVFRIVRTSKAGKEDIEDPQEIRAYVLFDFSEQAKNYMKTAIGEAEEIFAYIRGFGGNVEIGGRNENEFIVNDPSNYQKYFEKLIKDLAGGKARSEKKLGNIVLFSDLACTDLRRILDSEEFAKKLQKTLEKNGIKLHVIAVAPETFSGYNKKDEFAGTDISRKVHLGTESGKRTAYLETKDQFELMMKAIGAKRSREENGIVSAKGNCGSIVWLPEVDSPETYELYKEQLVRTMGQTK